MKIAKSSGQTSQSSSSDTHQFKISANGTAFQILSSGLYSNKHAAVLRELGCNAADAHVAAGITKTPIEVTLPTENNRELAIRDFGLGMSHEQILSLYTTYFSSDKRDSNAFVGGLGLGSKSPFAYTNSFTVTSIHQGVKRIYSCNIATDGAPTVTRLREEPTSEPQGIEVRLLTKQQDMHLFMREAASVFQWFETTPKFNVPIAFHHASLTTLSTPAYDIGKGYGASHFIKMGNVAYPLQIHSLDLPANTLWPQLLNRLPLILKAPIGHLQVAASREALQYDPTTKKNLLQLYQQAYNDIARRIVLEMTNPARTTAWTQESAVRDWCRTYLPSLDSQLIGQMIAQSGTAIDVQRAAGAVVKPTPKVPAIAGNSKDAGVYWYDADVKGRKNVERGFVSVGKNSVQPGMTQALETVIVVADDKQITEKISHWRDTHGLPSLLLVSPSTKNDLSFAQTHADAIAAALGGVPVMLLSQMPLPNTIVTPTIKRDYVEIDDRIVDVWDMATNKTTPTRFGDVPANMRYALVRDTAATKSQGVYYLESGAGTPSVLQQYHIERWAPLFAYMASIGKVWTGPTGAIVLRPVDVDRLKIQEAGVPWFLPSICAAFLDSKNQDFMDAANALWPQDRAVQAWHCAHNKMGSGWLGDFGVALGQMHKKSQDELRALLDDAALLDSVMARAAPVSKSQDEAWTGLCTIVSKLHELYPAAKNALSAPLHNAEQAQKMVEQFPLLAHVDSNALFEVVGHKQGDARQQQVFNLLRVCLGLPIGP